MEDHGVWFSYEFQRGLRIGTVMVVMVWFIADYVHPGWLTEAWAVLV